MWAAKFDGDPTNGRPFDGAIMDQYTSSGKLPGIVGNVDLNVFYGTKDEFLSMGKPLIGVQPVPPTGTPGIDPTIQDKLDAQTNILTKILVIVQAIWDTISRIFK